MPESMLLEILRRSSAQDVVARRPRLDRGSGSHLVHGQGDGGLAVDYRVLAEEDDLPRGVGNSQRIRSFLSSM